MWSTAWDLADSTNAAERRSHSAEIGRLAAERDDWISISEKLEDERDEETKRAVDAEADLEGAKTTIRDRELELAELHGRLAERLGQESASKATKNRRKPAAREAKPDPAENSVQLDMFPELCGQPEDPEAIAAE